MPAATPPLPMQQAAGDARCEALFASALQPFDAPDAGLIAAISSAVQRFGPRGRTERMAARRMCWARQLAAGGRPGPAGPGAHCPPAARHGRAGLR